MPGVGGMLQALECLCLNLSDALSSDTEDLPDLLQRMFIPLDAEPQADDLGSPGVQMISATP